MILVAGFGKFAFGHYRSVSNHSKAQQIEAKDGNEHGTANRSRACQIIANTSIPKHIKSQQGMAWQNIAKPSIAK